MSNFKKMDIPKEALIRFTEKLPNEIKKDKQGLTYISANTVIDMLNNTFGAACWSKEITERWIEKGRDVVKKPGYGKPQPPKEELKVVEETTERTSDNNAQITTRKELVKNTDNIIPQGDIAHVKVRLTVLFFNEDGSFSHQIVKEAYGSKEIIGNQRNQASIFKSATSDALKKAAADFGLGLELWRDQNEQLWVDQMLLRRVFGDCMEVKYLCEMMKKHRVLLNGFDSYVLSLTNKECSNILQMPKEKLKDLIKLLTKPAKPTGGEKNNG